MTDTTPTNDVAHSPSFHRRDILVFVLLLLLSTFGLYLATPQPNHLERVIESGKLRVITRNSPTTVYQGADGQTGLEYDLVQGFAQELGVDLVIDVADRFSTILPSVADGSYDLASAGLTVTDSRKQLVRFSVSYQSITPQLVRRISSGGSPPKSLDDLNNEPVHVIKGSSHQELIKTLREQHPNLQWVAHDDKDVDELLFMIWEGDIEYTVADSNELALSQRFYPELRAAFDLAEAKPLAWAFQKMDDDSLHRAANEYLSRIQQDGTLTQILERYYGHTDTLNYVGTREFMAQVSNRLPLYRHWFKQAAEDYQLDWRLLAAVSYQESHWRPNAVSPTGVRGLMMLTNRTAGQLGIDNRLDPQQSIFGGAEYLRYTIDRIPERITDPDRTWMGLASYNVGYGHLEDARKITQSLGDDPDKWIDVMKHLPKLSMSKWYKKTRYGYARGREPVQYVQNIRSYFDILVWLDEREKMHQGQTDAAESIDIQLRGL